MRFKQLKDVLDYLINAHQQMGEYYTQLSDTVLQQRVKLILDYLAEHENHISNELLQYEKDAPYGVLNAWFQDIQDDPLLLKLEQPPAPDLSEEQVMRIALELDDRLISLYEQLASHCKSSAARDALENLLDQEKQRKKRFVLSMLRMHDL